jgi:hypothetical protein
MTGGTWHIAKSAFWLPLLWGCQHEVDAAAPTSPVPSGIDGASAEVSPSTGVSADASAPFATVPSPAPDASTTTTTPPAPDPLDNVATPAYPPSALYDAFSKAKQRLVACYLPGRRRTQSSAARSS